MRIAFLLDPARALARVTTETIAGLRARGAQVDLLSVGEVMDLSDLQLQHDLYVLKSKSALTHSLAGAIEAAGGYVVNSFRSSVLTWDKVATTGVLAAAGVPVPASWTAGEASTFVSLLQDGPLWVKPQHGKSGSGVRRFDDPTELQRHSPQGVDAFGYPVPVFAQRDVPSGGVDFKVYVIGERMWSMTKHWPPRGPEDKLGTPVPLPDPIRHAALAAGRALGLELFGVDFLLPSDGSGDFAVVDVNAFPGYNGLAEAPAALTEYLFDRARARVSKTARGAAA